MVIWKSKPKLHSAVEKKIDSSPADITSNNISESDVDRQKASEALPTICNPIVKNAAATK